MNEIPYADMFCKGDHITLKLLSGEIFEGDYCDGGKHRIDLFNTKQHNNPNKLGGVHSFYRNEIDKIKTVKAQLTETPVQKKEKDTKRIKIAEEEYHRYKQMAKDFRYINKADKKYFDAVEVLNNAETIGIVPLGMESTKNASIKLLVISTWKEVFLFDFMGHTDGYFCPALKDMLESEYVYKVIHKGSHFVNVLRQNYKIYVQNTFDTQLVDLMIQKAENGECPSEARDISECLTHYFNLPTHLITDAVEAYKEDWSERPLSDEKKLYASQLATYLILLKEEMKSILLSQTHKTINKIHDFYYDISAYDFSVRCHTNNLSKDFKQMIPSIGEARLNGNDISKDLKELTTSVSKVKLKDEKSKESKK